ncbi:MAG TPA: transglutaminase-like domain-containing protein [Polyangiaceae bacterium]|nr:transglutaminase-like domain-containing protein [Polyangiaceae bacterium]
MTPAGPRGPSASAARPQQKRRPWRQFTRAGLALAAPLLLSLWVRAEGPLLHEYVPKDAVEDLELNATTPDGRMPVAIQTPNGPAYAPNLLDPHAPRQVVYGDNSTPDSIDATFRLDSDTSEPSFVHYDDPFTPSVAPFKRLFAFDAVDADFQLGVRDSKALRPVPLMPEAPPDHDRFFGDLFVDVAPTVLTRIPTVAPGTRLLALRVEPETAITLRQDAAENWFVTSPERKRLRLIFELSAPRAAFGGPFPDVSYEAISHSVTPLPNNVRRAVDDVLARLGLSRNVRPRDAIQTLVSYFRSFAPSDAPPNARGGAALYTELSLEKKGVCRHRAFSFMLTALGLGIPARFVRNEAHAWVEVGDGKTFRRIDLGGAAQRFDIDTPPGAPQHRMPEDPYAWPEGARSALQSTESSPPPNANPRPAASTPRPASSSSATSPVTSSARPAPSFSAPSPAATPPEGQDSPSQIEFAIEPGDVQRGATVRVRGRVTQNESPCPSTRVDIVLSDGAKDNLIGSVPTDSGGQFDSRVTIPFDVELGDHVVRATTPGALRCNPSR